MTTGTRAHPQSQAIVAAVRACIGTRFRSQGRVPGLALDCVGVALVAAQAAGEHINLTGDYLWRSSAKVGVGKFRPLRPFSGS
jgi:hypothetical protein